MKKYKVILSVVFGILCLTGAVYSPLMSEFLLTDKSGEWSNTNWILLGLGVLFLWGRISSIAVSLTKAVSGRLSRNTNLSSTITSKSKKKDDEEGGGATIPNEGF